MASEAGPRRLEDRTPSDSDTPVSDRIRLRIQEAGAPFHANDNISAYVEPDEIPVLQAEVEEKMKEVLVGLKVEIKEDL